MHSFFIKLEILLTLFIVIATCMYCDLVYSYFHYLPKTNLDKSNTFYRLFRRVASIYPFLALQVWVLYKRIFGHNKVIQLVFDTNSLIGPNSTFYSTLWHSPCTFTLCAWRLFLCLLLILALLVFKMFVFKSLIAFDRGPDFYLFIKIIISKLD